MAASPQSATALEKLRQALAALHDPAGLRRASFGRLLAPPVTGEELGRHLLAAIDGLRPTGPAPRLEQRHRLLTLRYVDARPANDVTRMLSISRSEFYREHAEALNALLAVLLQDHGEVQVGSDPPVEGAAGGAARGVYARTFVGREAEQAKLASAYAAAKSGVAGTVTVVGEPGIGKTALLQAFATQVERDGGRVLTGQCYEEGAFSLPYLPFIEAFGDFLRTAPGGVDGLHDPSLSELSRLVPELSQWVPVGAEVPADPGTQRWRLFRGAATLLRCIGQACPVVLVLEDLHDADQATLDLFVHLVRNLRDARVLLVGSYRNVQVARTHPLAAVLAELYRSPHLLRIPLRGLPLGEVQQMMEDIAQCPVPEPFADLVHRQTEGNPLFVREVLRYLVEEGFVAEQDGVLRRTGDETLAGRIPEGLRDVIGRRLSRLSPATNDLLQVAAVVGREFTPGIAQQLVRLNAEEAEAALGEAQRAGLVEETSRMPLTYAFTHALVRQTLYEELLAPQRSRLHHQAAVALEQQFGTHAAYHAVELADHFANGSDAADLGRALDYLALAAEGAIAVNAHGEADRHLQRALQLLQVAQPSDVARECALLVQRSEVGLYLPEPQRVAREIAPRAYLLAEQLGQPLIAGRVAVLAMQALSRHQSSPPMYRSDEFGSWVERAQRLVADDCTDRVYTEAYAGMHTLYTNPTPVPAHKHFRAAVEIASRLQEPSALFAAALWALHHLRALRDASLIRQLAEWVGNIPRNGVSTYDVGMTLSIAASTLRNARQPQQAEALEQVFASLLSETKDPLLELRSRSEEITKRFTEGRLRDVLALREQQAQREQELGLAQQLEIAMQNVVRARILLGETDGLLEGFLADRSRPARTLRASALAQLGRLDEAGAILREFPGIGEDADETADGMVQQLLLVAICIGDVGIAKAVGDKVGWRGDAFLTQRIFNPTRLLAEAAALCGDAERARALFDEACADPRNRPEQALAHLEYGEFLNAQSPAEPEGALEHLRVAIAEFDAMEMVTVLPRAMALRQKLTGDETSRR